MVYGMDIGLTQQETGDVGIEPVVADTSLMRIVVELSKATESVTPCTDSSTPLVYLAFAFAFVGGLLRE